MKLSDEAKIQKITERAMWWLPDMLRWASEWKTYPDWVKQMRTRSYYVTIQGSPKLKLNLVSRSVWKSPKRNKNGKLIPYTDDHFTIPQFTGYMMLDNPDIFLRDPDIFVKMFQYNCKVITVTSDENTALKKYTKKNAVILCGLLDRYKKEGIELVIQGSGMKLALEDAFPMPPTEYSETEKKYII